MMFSFLLVLCSVGSLAHYSTKWRCSLTESNTSVHLDCSNRMLRSIPEKLPSNVTELNLSLNQIERVHASSLIHLLNLTILDLNSNVIDNKETQFSHLKCLKTLLLDSNSLSKVPRDLPQGLSNLSLSSNEINSLNSNDFSGVPHIESINLDNNCYFCKIYESLTIGNGTFSKLNNLTNLSLAKNGLQKVPLHLPKSIVYLKLLLNTIAHINKSDFSGLTSLQFLDLSGNCPYCPNTPFPCKPCGDKGMFIHPEAFSHLHKLEELRLSGNSLETVDPRWFKKLTRLRYLFMSFNFLIGEISERGEFLLWLPLVEVMDLSYNNLKTSVIFPNLIISPYFSNMTSLRILHLQGYYFQKLDSRALKPLYHLQNLTVLNMGVNFLQQVNFPFLKHFYNLSVFTLVDNQVTLLSTRELKCCLPCGLDGTAEHSNTPVLFRPYIHRDEDYHSFPPAIKPECVNVGKVLDLSRNLIFYINPDFFNDIGNIACLNLSANSIGGHINGSQFKHFPKLKYLDLSHNKVYLSSDQAFTELKDLEILDLSYNSNYFQLVGLNHSLTFIRHLKSLKILDLRGNEISSLTDPHMDSSSLEKLNLARNRLDLMWHNSPVFHSLFKNLTRLQSLDLSLNMLRRIPKGVYKNLPRTLTFLNLNQNGLLVFDWSVLLLLPQLKELHLSKNKLVYVTKNLSSLTRQLQVLDLSHNNIAYLSESLLAGAVSMRILDLRNNHLTTFNGSTFQTGQDANLTLKLEYNSFHCTCDLLDFILWIQSSPVILPNLVTKVQCHLPESERGKSIVQSDMETCINSNIAQVFYAVSSSMVILMLSVAICAHLFYWDVSYIFSYLKAKVKNQPPNSAQVVYNAFVMYDTQDPLVSDWVLDHLRVELEEHKGEKVRPLCLEERDWVPGMPIMDNLMQSVRLSRKTIFVLTEGFMDSSLFKMAAFLVHQRLLEEGLDVMVLVLLQPVLRRSRILGLRRCLCQHSVLEWPTNPAAKDWFWQKLRSAVRMERQASHSRLHRRYFSGH